MEKFYVYRMRSNDKPKDFTWQCETIYHKYIGVKRELSYEELDHHNLEVVGKMSRRIFDNYVANKK